MKAKRKLRIKRELRLLHRKASVTEGARLPEKVADFKNELGDFNRFSKEGSDRTMATEMPPRNDHRSAGYQADHLFNCASLR